MILFRIFLNFIFSQISEDSTLQVDTEGAKVEYVDINGNSKHSKIKKIVSYEMFATKGSDREYLRLRRSIILKAIIENKNKASFLKIQKVLKANSLDESIETIKDDVIRHNVEKLSLDIYSYLVK